MKNTYCETCGKLMQKWGKTRRGTPRYRCSVCKTSSTIHRTDTRKRHEMDRLAAWLTGVESLSSVAKRLQITRPGLWKEFKPFFRKNPDARVPEDLNAQILIVDAKFIHGDELCTLIAVDEDDRIFWEFATDECYGTWYGFLVRFHAPKVVVADGEKGVALFVKRWWPKTAFQRCHFHMVASVIHYLSRNPKEEAGKEIMQLMYRLKDVKTQEEKKRWLTFHFIWERQHLKVFSLKHDSGGYANRKLRSVRHVIRRALPDLFTYLDYPGCPNTTNLVEGWTNTAIAEGLRRHRGLHLWQKKTLVSIILSHLRREKPTRKFT